MSHTIYHTEGFVLGSSDVGEANKYLRIYTKDYGLVGATAQGVRNLKSKLRYSLQDFSYSDISIVRGKDIWRITSASSHIDKSDRFLKNKTKKLVLSRMFALVRRLVQGEERDDRLFLILRNGYLFLQNEELQEQEIYNLEVILVLQVLNVLGYLDTPDKYLPFVESDIFSVELVTKLGNIKSGAVEVINTSLETLDL